MKKLIAILLSALLALSLFGCSPSGYKLTERDGNYYIQFDVQPEVPSSTDAPLQLEGLYPVRSVIFNSVAEMKNDIQTGNFTKEELEIISDFHRDDENRIQICDITKLYEPYFPQPFNSYLIYWRGNYYDYLITSSESEMTANHAFLGQEFVEDRIELFVHFEENELTTLHSKTIDSNNRVTYDYTVNSGGERCRMIYYCITTENDTLHIAEFYWLDESDSLPISIDIYTIDGAQSSRFFIFNIQEPLTLDQLSQFGIREYVETVTE